MVLLFVGLVILVAAPVLSVADLVLLAAGLVLLGANLVFLVVGLVLQVAALVLLVVGLVLLGADPAEEQMNCRRAAGAQQASRAAPLQNSCRAAW